MESRLFLERSSNRSHKYNMAAQLTLVDPLLYNIGCIDLKLLGLESFACTFLSSYGFGSFQLSQEVCLL